MYVRFHRSPRKKVCHLPYADDTGIRNSLELELHTVTSTQKRCFLLEFFAMLQDSHDFNPQSGLKPPEI